MEVIQQTQFAQFEKDFSKLPLFLQKKFEEAVIANSKKLDADRVTKKLERAEKLVNEQKEQQEMKRIQKRLNFEETLERGRQAKITQREYLNQVLAHKQKTADEIYATQLSLKINKAQTLGTKKVQEARTAREQEDQRKLQRMRNEKLVMSYPNVSVENARAEKKNKLVYKHYNILKNVHVRQFHSQRESLKKKEDIETKLANAESRKQKIIDEVVAKAIKTACKKDYGIVRESLQEKLLRKQTQAENNRRLILQVKIDKAKASYASKCSTHSNSSQTNTNDDAHLKIAQTELKTCYSIINAQKAANFKMLEEMTELKSQMESLQKNSSYNSKMPIAFTIGETMTKKFCNFDPVYPEQTKSSPKTEASPQSENLSWMII